MKKICAFVIFLSVVFSLCGCGNSQDKTRGEKITEDLVGSIWVSGALTSNYPIEFKTDSFFGAIHYVGIQEKETLYGEYTVEDEVIHCVADSGEVLDYKYTYMNGTVTELELDGIKYERVDSNTDSQG